MKKSDLEVLVKRVDGVRIHPDWPQWAKEHDERTQLSVAICIAHNEQLYADMLNFSLKFTKHLINKNIVEEVEALMKKEGLAFSSQESVNEYGKTIGS